MEYKQLINSILYVVNVIERERLITIVKIQNYFVKDSNKVYMMKFISYAM